MSGTLGAVATAVASFVLYNYLFTEPRFTLSMHEPGVWLSVVLLLFVGIVGNLVLLAYTLVDDPTSLIWVAALLGVGGVLYGVQRARRGRAADLEGVHEAAAADPASEPTTAPTTGTKDEGSAS